jgi:cysteine desulfurase family protein (TIGR01976 family)
MTALNDLLSAEAVRHRFPGVHAANTERWVRFDGPAGTQMVDVAIRAASDWSSLGSNANGHGLFPQADACDDLLVRARETVGHFLGADPAGVVFGANMTTLTLSFTRAIEQQLRPGQNVVGTRLDHDANVSPWRIACERSGAAHRLAPFDPVTGELDPASVIALIDEHTAWVSLPGASNLIGTAPDLAPIIRAAHQAGARVFIDAVALAPHRRIDITALGCDALATSPYKWYGPHAGVLWCRPDLLDSLPVAKVRPADPTGPRRFETGTPNFEGIAATEAAARFLAEEGMDRIAQSEMAVFSRLLDGVATVPGLRVAGINGTAGRVPTLSFTIDGFHPDDIARHLAADRIAVWSGHSYAVEVVEQLGLTEKGGVVRAGVVRYIGNDDIDRMITSLSRLTR